MESRIHHAGTCDLSGRSAAVTLDAVRICLRLLTPEGAAFSHATHTNLNPAHADPESLEVAYLKIEADLRPGPITCAVAFGINAEPDDVALGRDGGRLTLCRGG